MTSPAEKSRSDQVAEPPQPSFSRIETDSSQVSSGFPSEAENSDSECSAGELRKVRRELEREKHRNTQLQAQLKRQTQLQGQLQLAAEQEEEYITNKLMKRLEVLKHEKEELARQVEVEEEMITNALTKKLLKVKEEKVHLENQLEQEQEYIVNKLQKQLSQVMEEKRALETRLRDNTGAILTSIQQHLARWTNSASSPGTPKTDGPALAPGAASVAAASSRPASALSPTALAPSASPVISSSSPGAQAPTAAAVGVSDADAAHLPTPTPLPGRTAIPEPLDFLPGSLPGSSSSEQRLQTDGEWQRTHLLVSHLTREIDQLGEEHDRVKEECESHRLGNDKLRTELSRLQSENAGLCHRVAREREIRAQAILEKARLETELELDSERVFNYAGSGRSSVTSSPAMSSSVSSLPPTWALPSPRGLTPSILTPSVVSASSHMASQQLSPIRAPSPKLPTTLPTTPSRDAGHATPTERRLSNPSTPISPRDRPRATSNEQLPLTRAASDSA